MPAPARPIEPFFFIVAPELFMPGRLPPGAPLEPGFKMLDVTRAHFELDYGKSPYAMS